MRKMLYKYNKNMKYIHTNVFLWTYLKMFEYICYSFHEYISPPIGPGDTMYSTLSPIYILIPELE